MTTRTAAELIDEIRFDANLDANDARFTDDRLLKYLNSAQRQIQKIIYTANPTGNPFAAQKVYTPVQSGVANPMPDDIFAINAIVDITPQSDSNSLVRPLRFISLKEKNRDFGYFRR